MVITIVFANCIEDFADYIKLIEIEENLWFIENLVKWGVQPNVNPFVFANNYIAIVLYFIICIII